jgi:PBSX family phage terminase large subunit
VKVCPLEGKARQALGHKASIVALEGSVRSGKTFASLIDFLNFLRHGPKGSLLLVGRTERTVVENLVVPIAGMVGYQRVILNRGYGSVRILDRYCSIVGAPNEEAVTKIQGRTLAGAYVDEASAIPESFFTMLYSRLSIPGAQMWLTSNPESPAHWLKTEWLDKAKLWIDREGVEHVNPAGLDLVRISFKLEDNERNLPPDYVEHIKQAYTGLWYRRYILGDWCIAADAIYESWDPTRHVIHDLPELYRLLSVGIDYGDTAPTRGCMLGVSVDGQLIIVDEWVPRQGLTQAGFSADFRQWLGNRQPEWVCVDPAEAGFRNQLYTDGVSNTAPADNTVLQGIRLIASLLATDKLVISDRCPELIRELAGYRWDPKATARGEDAPLKQNDHSCDALRYAVVSTHSLWGGLVPITMLKELEATR